MRARIYFRGIPPVIHEANSSSISSPYMLEGRVRFLSVSCETPYLPFNAFLNRSIESTLGELVAVTSRFRGSARGRSGPCLREDIRGIPVHHEVLRACSVRDRDVARPSSLGAPDSMEFSGVVGVLSPRRRRGVGRALLANAPSSLLSFTHPAGGDGRCRKHCTRDRILAGCCRSITARRPGMVLERAGSARVLGQLGPLCPGSVASALASKQLAHEPGDHVGAFAHEA